ncbi:MAG: transglutaminase family protein [Burkholderiaceae bacterium]
MRLRVDHQTHYEYESPLHYAIQRVYLTPRDEPGQRVLQWETKSDHPITHQRDAYGNWVSTIVVSAPSTSVSIYVLGEVECDHARVQSGWTDARRTVGEPPLDLFLRTTSLTAPTAEMADFAREQAGNRSFESLLQLACAIESRLVYSPGVTEVYTSAADAWRKGAGVCQDHAHVMLACCRSLGVPARYVSGYVSGEARASEATHAWVDVWIQDRWRGLDVTHCCEPGDRWLRLAVGPDYDAVSPVRGVRQGGGRESMRVAVSVST